MVAPSPGQSNNHYCDGFAVTRETFPGNMAGTGKKEAGDKALSQIYLTLGVVGHTPIPPAHYTEAGSWSSPVLHPRAQQTVHSVCLLITCILGSSLETWDRNVQKAKKQSPRNLSVLPKVRLLSPSPPQKTLCLSCLGLRSKSSRGKKERKTNYTG